MIRFAEDSKNAVLPPPRGRSLFAACLLLSLLLPASQVLGQAKGVKKGRSAKAAAKRKKASGKARRKKTAKGEVRDKHITFQEIKIMGEREAPNVIYIVPWTPPKSGESEGDEAVDDLDSLFTSIRHLDRRFNNELIKPEDRRKLHEDYQLKKKARAYVQGLHKKKKKKRKRKGRGKSRSGTIEKGGL